MPTDTENILNLLAATILADKRIRDVEIESFATGVTQLTSSLNIEIDVSEANITSWFDMHKEEIRKKSISPYSRDWICEILENLSHLENKQVILKIMRDIAKSDAQFHISERSLISFAQRIGVITQSHLASNKNKTPSKLQNVKPKPVRG